MYMDSQSYEVKFPATPPPVQPTPSPRPGTAPRAKRIIFVAVLIAALALVSLIAYVSGYNQGRGKVAQATAAEVPLKVPQGATIISQCAVGRGTQYVLPANIPHGPVFNVYKGNVIGIEFMIGSDDLASATNFFDLPLYGKKYDHIDVGLVSSGHAGYPQRHYHVDIYNISRDESAAITCK
jgi:hypothetical protein